ncbi:MAG TPA: hypothetical protein DCM15_03780 [Cryomorphaceae bacterium]|nr:hypothetical protein [Cryomorphaceae bacterium]|tara:strand:+ start:2304 stop:3683 length:1380 start_codon:yes stop_codon:yes gene_type:complete
MKKNSLSLIIMMFSFCIQAQLSPAITSWLQNTTQIGTYYVSGNSTPISNNILVNCQQVEYSATSVYVMATGIPAYPTGPFLDGNPSNATDQSAIYKFTLTPQQNSGTPTSTTGNNIGVFVNGVSLFDYRDGVSWNPGTSALCGGPGNPPCPGGPMSSRDWNRDAIPAEMAGFDCSKAHPAMGNYHHHQNPSAFKLDLNVVSTICNIYDADGLYAMDSTQHSPLIGFAYDGFPIYGAYGYMNADGTGGVVRIESGYELRSMTARTTHADGSTVSSGPAINTTFPLGYFREDYGWISHPNNDEYLDEHNGRFCVTPEYPNGTYAYFCTVDNDWNSTYPYVVGPTFYGIYTQGKVANITETTTVYTSSIGFSEAEFGDLNLSIFPNPASDLIAIQIQELVKDDLRVSLLDLSGRVVKKATINKGSTIAYFDVQTVYQGTYIVQIQNGSSHNSIRQKIVILRD